MTSGMTSVWITCSGCTSCIVSTAVAPIGRGPGVGGGVRSKGDQDGRMAASNQTHPRLTDHTSAEEGGLAVGREAAILEFL